MDEEKEKHQFHLRNFVIPIEVGLNKKLDKTCCLLFSLINMLDNYQKHCFASNAYLANLLDVAINTVSGSISTLIEQGYIEQISFDGRKRTIRINPEYKELHKNLKEESDNRITNNGTGNSQPTSDRVGSLHRNDEEIKDINEYDKKNNSVILTRNGVPRKLLIKRKQSIREIHKQEKQKPTPVKSILVPVSVKEIIDYWQFVGLKVHDIETKAYKSAVKDIEKVLNGTMFADYTHPDFIAYTKMKFSVNNIKRAIDRHLERRFNVEYMPTNKEPLNNITLSNFFFNRFVTIEAYKSEFLICYCKPLVKTTNNKQLELSDDQPNVTKLLENWYKKTFAYKINGSYSVMDRNTIIKTGRALKEFVKTNNKTLNISRSHFMMHGIFNDPVLYLAESLTRLFDEELRNNDTLYTIFEPSWLTSELTMTSRLPKFLKNEGVLR